MVRSFAACLGCIAMLTQIALGLVLAVESETILVQSVIALLIASAMGWIIGKLADALVRDSIEARKRLASIPPQTLPNASSEAASTHGIDDLGNLDKRVNLAESNFAQLMWN